MGVQLRMKKDYQTHVFTCTYTADVSGVCSAMYELGGMTVLHDPSGCNSTYTTHDEPRWYDSDSLMFVSGLDEITAVMGDDTVLIKDVVQAARDLHPRFITLCGASIPHIIAFDYKGVAHLIEEKCGIPVLPVPTDGLRSYVSGADLAFRAFTQRFCDPSEYQRTKEKKINLLGVTPLDFSINGNVEALRKTFEEAGFEINACMAMGDTFEQLVHAYRAGCNVVVSSAGRKTARYMKKQSGMPFVEGLPVGEAAAQTLLQAVMETLDDGLDRNPFADISCSGEEGTIPQGIVVIGEEVFSRSLAYALNALPETEKYGQKAFAFSPDPDEGIAEQDLIRVMRSADTVIADPLYQVVQKPGAPEHFVKFPHEAYSGRIFRDQIPVFAGKDYQVCSLLKGR